MSRLRTIDRAALVAAYRAGVPVSDLCASHAGAYRILDEAGVPRRRTVASREEIERIEADYRAGVPVKEIPGGVQRVRYVVKKLDLPRRRPRRARA